MIIEGIFHLILLIGISAVENSTGFIEQSPELVKTAQTEIQCKNDNSILSCDYVKAKNALLVAEKNSDFATIRLGLKRDYSFELKMDIIKVIERLNDKSFVPDLVCTLESNQGSLSGGTETAVAQALLSRELITIIGKLTHIEFKLPTMPNPNSIEKFEPENYVTKAQIKEALRETHTWMEKQ